jgi:hypothetical protein
LDDYVAEENPVRVIDVFVDELDLAALKFEGVVPDPSLLLDDQVRHLPAEGPMHEQQAAAPHQALGT